MTINQFYTDAVRPLPAGDRLRLASLILEDLSAPNSAVVDVSDEWSDHDLRDLTAHAVGRLDDEASEDQ